MAQRNGVHLHYIFLFIGNMTAKDIFELRRQGRKEEAYEAARTLYATDNSSYTSSAMFWTAVDMLKLRINEGRIVEAGKILLSLERMPNVPDKNGFANDALEQCRILVEKGKKQQTLREEGPEHLQMGIWGEELATSYLREKGYVILERDWHSKHRDIDIIAQDGELTVFVEVKIRSSRLYGDPIQSVDYAKRYNLRRAINHYIHYRNIDKYRFDVITIIGALGCTTPEIEHIEDFNIMEQERWHPRRR